MQVIKESEYQPNMGILIDVRKPSEYNIKHNPYSINISYDELMMNYQSLLNKNTKYYLICNKGNKSKQATRMLTFYGYNVTYVINS